MIQVASMPSQLQGGFQATPPDFTDINTWHWLDVQKVRMTELNASYYRTFGIYPIYVICDTCY